MLMLDSRDSVGFKVGVIVERDMLYQVPSAFI